MIDLSNKYIEKQKERRGIQALIIWCVLFFTLLLLRDGFMIAVNKNIFTLMAMVCVVTMTTEQVLCLYAFLFPLYFGLPGNYLTILLLLKMLTDIKHVRFTVLGFVATLLVCAYALGQNMVDGKMGIIHMVFVISLVLVFFIFQYQGRIRKNTFVLLYSSGVAALGLIMLVGTLTVHELEDLMSVGSRLGTTSAGYAEKGVMNVIVDPNFYGSFAISAISVAVPLALKGKIGKAGRLMLLLFSVISLSVGIIGLSRAFLLVIVAWFILYLFSQKNVKSALTVLIVLTLICLLVFALVPDALEAVFERFEDADMETGNGRIRLMNQFLSMWGETLASMLFGVGLFNCSVHCTPLQYLYGGGLILVFLLFVYIFCSLKEGNGKFGTGFSMERILPFMVTFVMMCTIPSATMLSSMFPLIYVALVAWKLKD